MKTLHIKFITYFRYGMSSTQANALPAAFSSLKYKKKLINKVYLKLIKKKEQIIIELIIKN